jgi:ATP-dependent Clp protease ATP-binding subunit ClpC
MYERFTDGARKTMQLAVQEANRLGHERVDTEHILLGLLKEGTGAGSRILREAYEARRIKLQIEKSIRTGEEPALPGRRPPFTPRAKQTIEDATQEARQLGKNYVGTEHLLLALLRNPEGVAAQVLQECGVTYSDAKGRLEDPLAPLADELRDPSAAADPQHVDRLIRQAIGQCWNLLPGSRRDVDEVTTQIRRIVERALRDFGQDAEAFGA